MGPDDRSSRKPILHRHDELVERCVLPKWSQQTCQCTGIDQCHIAIQFKKHSIVIATLHNLGVEPPMRFVAWQITNDVMLYIWMILLLHRSSAFFKLRFSCSQCRDKNAQF